MAKSGIELLEDLRDQIFILNKRFEIIEQNTKELLNRSNGFGRSVQPEKPKPQTATITIPEVQPAKTSKVMGKIKNEDGKFLSGVSVKISNENGEIIKETKTNRAGEWLSFLPPGSYSASYFLKDLVDTNIRFMVSKEQKLIRVAQAK